MKWKLVCIVAMIWPGKLSAQEWPPFSAEVSGSPQYRQCVSASEDNMRRTSCLEQEYARQSDLLELAYLEQLRDREPAERQALVAAQNAWIAFRDANCRVRNMNPGSGVGIFTYGCLVRETITRRTEIENLWDY